MNRALSTPPTLVDAPLRQRTTPVVVVNADSALRRSLSFALAVEGFAVREFGSGSEALAADDLPWHACVIADQRLVDMTGLELVERLRACGSRMAVILIGTRPTGRLRRQVHEAGVNLVEQPLHGDAIVHEVIRSLTRLTDPNPV